MERIVLPEPVLEGEISVEEAIERRRSVRSFSPEEPETQAVGRLLWSAQGVTDKSRGLRAAPSAGATYPLEVYLVSSEGVYIYKPAEHSLEPVKEGDMRGALSRAALGQKFVAEAPVSIVLTVVYSRTEARYGGRARRYAHIETGHAAQNIHLQAVALGLASVPVGAFNDSEVKGVLNLPDNHEPLYIIPAGYQK